MSKKVYRHITIKQAEKPHISADSRSLLFDALIPANRVAKCKETKSIMKFSKKYMSIYKVFTTINAPYLIIYILTLCIGKPCHNLLDEKIF